MSGIFAEAEKSFEMPDEGSVQGVCADLIDLGIVPTKFGPKHKVQFVFQIEQTEEGGTRMQVRSGQLALKSGEKSSLQQFVEAWRGGKKFTRENPLSDLDLTTLIGEPALLSIVHETVGDKTYANIGTITKLPKGVPVMKVEGYVRRVKKEKDTPAKNTKAAQVGKGEDLPF